MHYLTSHHFVLAATLLFALFGCAIQSDSHLASGAQKERPPILAVTVEGISFGQSWSDVDGILRRAGYSTRRAGGGIKNYTKQEGNISKKVQLVKDIFGTHLNIDIISSNYRTKLDNAAERKRLTNLLGEPDGPCPLMGEQWSCRYTYADKAQKILVRLTASLTPIGRSYAFLMTELPKGWKPQAVIAAEVAARNQADRQKNLERELDRNVTEGIRALRDVETAKRLQASISNDSGTYRDLAEELREPYRKRAQAALDEWLSGAMQDEERELDYLPNSLTGMQSWRDKYVSFRNSYHAAFPTTPSVQRVEMAYLDKRKDQLSKAEHEINSLLAGLSNPRAFDKAVAKNFDRDIDSRSTEGSALWTRIDAERAELQRQQELSKYSRLERSLMGDGRQVSVPARYAAPTAEEMRLAIMREQADVQGHDMVDGHTLHAMIPMPLLGLVGVNMGYYIMIDIEPGGCQQDGNGGYLCNDIYKADAELDEATKEGFDAGWGFASRPDPGAGERLMNQVKGALMKGYQGLSEKNRFVLTPNGWRSPTENQTLRAQLASVRRDIREQEQRQRDNCSFYSSNNPMKPWNCP